MKSNYLFTFIVFFFTAVSYCQDVDINSNEFHLKKRKSNNTAGWILIGTGTLAIGGGLAMDFSDNFHLFETNPPPYNYTGITIACIGGGMILGSIPCFSSARKHKKLAQTSISLKNMPYPNGNLSYNYQSAVSISIKF